MNRSTNSVSIDTLVTSPLYRKLFARTVNSDNSIVKFGGVSARGRTRRRNIRLTRGVTRGVNGRANGGIGGGIKVGGLSRLHTLPTRGLVGLTNMETVPACGVSKCFVGRRPMRIFTGNRRAGIPLLVKNGGRRVAPLTMLVNGRPAIRGVGTNTGTAFKRRGVSRLFHLCNVGDSGSMLRRPNMSLTSSVFLSCAA